MFCFSGCHYGCLRVGLLSIFSVQWWAYSQGRYRLLELVSLVTRIGWRTFSSEVVSAETRLLWWQEASFSLARAGRVVEECISMCVCFHRRARFGSPWSSSSFIKSSSSWPISETSSKIRDSSWLVGTFAFLSNTIYSYVSRSAFPIGFCMVMYILSGRISKNLSPMSWNFLSNNPWQARFSSCWRTQFINSNFTKPLSLACAPFLKINYRSEIPKGTRDN